jgi:hypothetical protein
MLFFIEIGTTVGKRLYPNGSLLIYGPFDDEEALEKELCDCPKDTKILVFEGQVKTL